ncbi:MAG: hypothetical protein ABIP79_09050 [Chitinophagaceae bacterium]
MSSSSNIIYLRQWQINKTKWDSCIEAADNGLIYGYSFYLDAMSKNWDALILNDYEAVMPLPWNKKYGIAYIYQPFLTAQLGIFGKQISEKLVTDFIASIPSSFRYIDIALNKKNLHGIPIASSTYYNNYELDLNFSYEYLYDNYRENIQRNIKKAYQQGCTVQKNIDVEKIIDLAILQMKTNGHESKENIDRFRTLFTVLQNQNMTSTYGIVSKENKLLASCVFFFSHNRAFYILVGNHPDGKSSGASHALIDAFIKDNAGKSVILDFEGSDIPTLAFFYSSFGAENEVYPAIKINRLPFYLKWLKK